MTSVRAAVWTARVCEAPDLRVLRDLLETARPTRQVKFLMHDALTEYRFGVIRTVPGPSRPEQSE